MSEKYDIEDFTANISEGCMYEVRERWCTEKRWCVFIMLNPSHIPQNPENLKGNNTVGKCRSIAKDKYCECGGMILLDLYPFPACSGTKLKEIKGDDFELDEVQKKKHDDCFHNALKNKDALIIMAWGDKSEKIEKSIKSEESIRDTNHFLGQIGYIKGMIRDYVEKGYIKSENVMQLEVKGSNTGKIIHPSWRSASHYGLEKFDYS